MKKYDLDTELSYEEFKEKLDNLISSKVPIDALIDISEWILIYKSPISNSFYNVNRNKQNRNGAIRISDHWNYKKRNRRNQKGVVDSAHIYHKTDVKIKGKWAMGIYDNVEKIYKISKVYTYSEYVVEKTIMLRKKLDQYTDNGRYTKDDIRKRMNVILNRIDYSIPNRKLKEII